MLSIVKCWHNTPTCYCRAADSHVYNLRDMILSSEFYDTVTCLVVSMVAFTVCFVSVGNLLLIVSLIDLWINHSAHLSFVCFVMLSITFTKHSTGPTWLISEALVYCIIILNLVIPNSTIPINVIGVCWWEHD